MDLYSPIMRGNCHCALGLTNAVNIVRTSHRLAHFFRHFITYSLFCNIRRTPSYIHTDRKCMNKQVKMNICKLQSFRDPPTLRKLIARPVPLHPALNFQRLPPPLSFEGLWYSMSVRKRTVFLETVIQKTDLSAERLNVRLCEIHHGPSSELAHKLSNCSMAVFGNYIKILAGGKGTTIREFAPSSVASSTNTTAHRDGRQNGAATSPQADEQSLYLRTGVSTQEVQVRCISLPSHL